MAATVHNVYVCPRCDHEIISLKQGTTCPGCGLILGVKEGRIYQQPMPLSEQHARLQNNGQHLDMLLNLRINKCQDILEDALHILQTLPAKKVRVSDISSIVKMGIQIGEVASAYNKFLEAGGSHVPGTILNIEEERSTTPPSPTTAPPDQENQSEQYEQTGDRNEASASPADDAPAPRESVRPVEDID